MHGLKPFTWLTWCLEKRPETLCEGLQGQGKSPRKICVCLCGFSGALNCQYCTQGCSKNNLSNVHPSLKGARQFVRMMSNREVKKALKEEKWKTRISMVSLALPCTEHLLWSLDIENGKGYLRWKESLWDPLFFFSYLCFMASVVPRSKPSCFIVITVRCSCTTYAALSTEYKIE